MEFIKTWLIIGAAVSFFFLSVEYIIGYDRVKPVLEANPELIPYETSLRVLSTIFMVIIWPWNVYTFIVTFIRAFIKGFNNHE